MAISRFYSTFDDIICIVAERSQIFAESADIVRVRGVHGYRAGKGKK